MAGWLLAYCLLAPAADNLLLNGGCELDDGGWVAFWEARTPSDAMRRLVCDDQVAHGGRRSLKIENAEKTLSRWRTGHRLDLAIAPGTPVKLTGWIRTAGVPGAARLRLYLMAGDKIAAQPGSGQVSGDQDWTQVTVAATAPGELTWAMAYCELEGPGTAWFDDLVLTGTVAEVEPPAGRRLVLTAADAWDLTDYQVVVRGGQTVLEIPPEAGAKQGEALFYFRGETGRYRVFAKYLDEPDGASTASLAVNGRPLAEWRFDGTAAEAKEAVAERELGLADLQRNSKLVWRGTAEAGELARLVALELAPAGRFGGTLLPAEQLPPPPDLRVYQQPAAAGLPRGGLGEQLNRAVAAQEAKREAELAALTTPEAWRAYQARIRARLADYFGPFPERTPLKPRVVGTIDRGATVIEKVLFESRPGHLVSANFYHGRAAGPAPGVLLVCGHSAEGKGYHLYHECALGLVLKGYAVLAIDPTGQGERLEYFDPETLKDNVGGPVAQHHQLGRPSFLVGRTLSGHRVWDAVRAVDYLVSRAEVDPARLGVVGNSGGGQMAFLTAAVDERVLACAAAHPGGSMENTYLIGQSFRDKEILCLIAPRPCRVIVGKDSGENYHAKKVEDLLRFYRGLGAPERCELVWVDGVHNLEQPKRVAAYEWLNRWLGRIEAGSDEPPLEPLKAEELWCAPRGSLLADLHSRSGQDINRETLAALRRRRTTTGPDDLRAAVSRRLGLKLPDERTRPVARPAGALALDGLTAELLCLETEPGLYLPAVLFRPEAAPAGRPVILHTAQWGKPARADRPSLPLELARRGYPVLSLDVRDAGELDPRQGRHKPTAAGWDPDQWARDSRAIAAWGHLGTALPALQASDVLRASAFICDHEHLAGRRVIAVGEELGGLWALLAGGLGKAIDGVITVRTLLSLEMLVDHNYHEARGYFWMPEAVADFDLPELGLLVAPRRVAWVAPVDALGRPVGDEDWRRYAGAAADRCAALGGRLERRDAAGAGPAELAAAVERLIGSW